MQESTIDIKKGTMTLFPKKGWHIEIDDVLNAVDGAGFTPRAVWVAWVGKLIEWNGKTALSIVSKNKDGKKIETKYLLKENERLKKLLASVKTPAEKVFIAGKAVKETPNKHKDHPYTIVIEKFAALSKEGQVSR